MTARVRVRRARHLVSYWTDEGMVITNYATNSSVVGDALVAHILGHCAEWTSLRDLRVRLRGIPQRTIDDLVAEMINRRLLVRSDGGSDPRERALDTWRDWNPAAGFFHLSTKDLPTPANPEAAELALSQEAKAGGMPAGVKRYSNAPDVRLPPPNAKGPFADVLLDRRTWRSFDDAPVALADISTLLHLTWGVQRTVELAGLDPVRLKTSPSSGARQPLEAYMLARAVDGLEPGLYHYRGDDHALERIRKGATSRTIQRYIPGQWWYDSAAAVFLMTAVFARTQWRYRFARAYRSVLLEAGHVCQTFCLAATWLGLAPFCTGRFADSYVERQLRIDGVTESFVYGAGVGRRPPGVAWAPWALDGSPDHPLMARRSRRRNLPTE
jgi:SagB-type dehydrogenase family enzyme